MTGKRRRFTGEFKEEAVRLLVHRGRPLAQVARELGVHENVLRKWKTAVGTGWRAGTSPVSGPFTLAEENRRLRSELARVKEERDILKKATAFFARESR
jgi:transposase